MFKAILGLLIASFVYTQAFADTKILKADRMLDVKSGKIISPVTIVIKDGLIEAVNPSSLPTDAEVINLGDKTILPGLMDMHTHLAFDIEAGWATQAVRYTAGDLALRGAKNAKLTLDAGFTTVRDLGAGYFADVSLMHAIEKGFVVGPRMFPAGHSLSITGGHCDRTGFIPGVLEGDHTTGLADGVSEALKAVRYQIKHGAKVIKICATAGVLSLEGPVGAQQFSDTEMKAIVEEAARHGQKVAAHAHGTQGIKAAVKAGVASIDHGSMLDDEAIKLMIKHGTYLVPTLYLANSIDLDAIHPQMRAKAEYVLPLAVESSKAAIKAGVKFAFGTDAAVFPHGDNAKEFGVLVEYGMTPLQAIQSSTINSADLLGVTDRGVIEAGKLADIIAVDGNPLEDVTVLESVGFVMIGGKVAKY